MAGAMPHLTRVLEGSDEALANRVRAALKLPPALRKRPDAQPAASPVEAKAFALKSYEKGYMKDALKYLAIAHESDPLDFEVMLKLGWANNMLKQDDDAVRWFDLARRAPDDAIAAEAHKAYKNLAQARENVATTFWIFPMFSSRWRDAFTYSQLKSEIKFARLPRFRPYFSARLLADARGIERSSVTNGAPQYLSESAGIFGVGFSTVPVHGVSVWAEGGTSLSYRARPGVPRAAPDYRGGIVVAKFFGTALGAERPGWFTESMNDGVFVSRFDNDFLIVSQNKFGKTVHPNVQLFAAANVTTDTKRQYWANFVEGGGGVRTRWPGLPPNVHFTLQVLRGAHTLNRFNPRRPNFFDVRAGFWYAITR